MSFQMQTKPEITHKCKLSQCGKEFKSTYPNQLFCTTICTQAFHLQANCAKKRKKRTAAPSTPYARKASENKNRTTDTAFNSKWLARPMA